MGRYDTEYWVWHVRPGLPHLTAKEFGGQAAPTFTAAMALARGYIQEGYLVTVYRFERRAHNREEGASDERTTAR